MQKDLNEEGFKSEWTDEPYTDEEMEQLAEEGSTDEDFLIQKAAHEQAMRDEDDACGKV